MIKSDFDEIITNAPLVIDNGSGMLKAGFAGEETPKCVFPSFIGKPKYSRVMAGAIEGDIFVGQRAEEYRGLLSLKYPIQHGIVTDWLGMESIWTHLFSELKVNAEEHPVLLTEAPLNPRKNREKAAEIFFETFNSPALFVSPQAILSMYSWGRTTGVVLDSGDGVTHVVPIFEGFALSHAIMRSDVAGRDITGQLALQLRRLGHTFHTTAEAEIVKNIKETACFVSMNPQIQQQLKYEQTTTAYPYLLPDGSVVQLGDERHYAPEILFYPSLIGLEYVGVHELLTRSIANTDIDLRKTLYSLILLSGGSTLFPGFGDRLLNELRKHAPRDIKIRISAPPERRLSTWIGGSILASLPTFKKMWVTRPEYEENGAAFLHHRGI